MVTCRKLCQSTYPNDDYFLVDHNFYSDHLCVFHSFTTVRTLNDILVIDCSNDALNT